MGECGIAGGGYAGAVVLSHFWNPHHPSPLRYAETSPCGSPAPMGRNHTSPRLRVTSSSNLSPEALAKGDSPPWGERATEWRGGLESFILYLRTLLPPPPAGTPPTEENIKKPALAGWVLFNGFRQGVSPLHPPCEDGLSCWSLISIHRTYNQSCLVPLVM